MSNLPDLLAERLKRPLPGRSVQVRFEPEMSYGRHYAPPPADARQAAVMALLYRHHGEWYLPLTLRPETMVDHANQVSFPGGLIEENEDSYQAAIRELREELGVWEADIRPLGRLSPLYLFVSNFQVTPWVAAIEHRPDFKPNSYEVAELLEVPLAHLLAAENVGSHRRRQRGLEFAAPHYAWGEHPIWGATSMMLAELVAIVEEQQSGAAR